jgi:TPR repeat protein
LFTSLLLMGTPAPRAAAAKLLADEGDAAGQFVYGTYVQRGRGVDVDETEACEYFK